MPTPQKLQQKHTKATQKVGGSAKKPVTKVVGGGKAAPSKGKTTRGGSAKGGAPWNIKSTENAKKILQLDLKITKIEEAIPKLVKMIRFIYNVNCENLTNEIRKNEKLTKETQQYMLIELEDTIKNLDIDYGEKVNVGPRSVYNVNCKPVNYPYGLNVNSPK